MLTAIAYCKGNNFPLTVVFSERKILHKFRIKQFISKMYRLYMQNRLGFQFGVPLVIIEDVNADEFRKVILPEDVGIIAGFNQIFHEETIHKFKYLVNFHPSLLPLYRGPVPSYWCIQNGERMTGYTLHEVTKDIDSGKVLHQEKVEIKPGMTESELDQAIATVARKTLKDFLQHLQRGNQWEETSVNAYEVYINPLSYASFPKR